MRKKFLVIGVIAALLACQGEKKASKKPSETKKAVVKPSVDGEAVFKMNCVICHGADGKLGINNAGDITKSEMSLTERIELIKKGKTTMTPFENILSEDKIKAVAEYSMKLK